MRISLLAFTETGMELEKRLGHFLEREGHFVRMHGKSKFAQVPSDCKITMLSQSVGEWAEEEIPKTEGVIFIGAVGIAVRIMAPFVKSKQTDPAVVVVDERGQFSISLLSGHLGGANALADFIAQETGAIPVITTATDIEKHFAVDVFAKANGLHIADMTLAKEVSAKVLQGQRLLAGAGRGFVEKEGETVYPELDFLLRESPDGKNGTFWIQVEEGRILHLIPKNIVLGLGCRRGTKEEDLEEKIEEVFGKEGFFPEAIGAAASIDLKMDEEGLLNYGIKKKIPISFYTKEQLLEVEGTFESSQFVSSVTGVDNVCERSAVRGSRDGKLIIKKQAGNGMTVAAAARNWSVEYV